jgi:hypothetical protein
MIVLPIYNQEDDDTPAEWSLLELNGELLAPKKDPEGDSMELGKIKFDSEVCVFSSIYVYTNSLRSLRIARMDVKAFSNYPIE